MFHSMCLCFLRIKCMFICVTFTYMRMYLYVCICMYILYTWSFFSCLYFLDLFSPQIILFFVFPMCLYVLLLKFKSIHEFRYKHGKLNLLMIQIIKHFNYELYGGRGIVCLFHSFFINEADMLYIYIYLFITLQFVVEVFYDCFEANISYSHALCDKI